MDCLHGDDEFNCDSWKMDDYFKHIEPATGRDSDKFSEDADDDNEDVFVREPTNLRSELPLDRKFTCERWINRKFCVLIQYLQVMLLSGYFSTFLLLKNAIK